jgi:phosphopentomutase
MQEVSAGKDSTTGHWELAGLILDRPFPTFPDGFPQAMIDRFMEVAGVRGVLGNRAASGTKIIETFGERHQETGFPIVYTSADSVFQIAAHKSTIPREELYRMCEAARDRVCTGDAAVGRVIARPFVGSPGSYQRVSGERKDYSLKPPAEPMQTRLRQAGVRTLSVGKVYDLFGGEGFDRSLKSKTNAEGVTRILECIEAYHLDPCPTFVWANLVDFDQEFGHRNDPEGFAAALEGFDRALPGVVRALPAGGVLVITADHGNDPTTPSTDHSREYVPLLVYRPGTPAISLGIRRTFADHAAALAKYFGVEISTGATRW